MSDEQQAVATVQMGGELANIEAQLEAFAGEGSTDVGSKDRAKPFLAILQKGSPQVDDTSGKYLEGAKQGMVYNNVTNELFDTRNTPITVIDCVRMPLMVEWTPRDSGGGFVAQHAPDDPIVKTAKEVVTGKKRQIVLPNGNLLVETMYHFVLLLLPEGIQWAVIGMSSTQLTTSKKWNMIIDTQLLPSGKVAPTFAFEYLLSTAARSNDFGSWFGWEVKKGNKVSDIKVLNMAIDYRKAVLGGQVQVATPVAEHASATSASGGAVADEDVPF